MENQPASTQPPATKKSKLTIVLIIVGLIVLQLGILWAITQFFGSRQESSQVSVDPELSAVISITDEGFVPQTIQVQKGTLVTWVNNATQEHSVASGPYPTNDELIDFNSEQPLNPGDSYSFVFEETGSFNYVDNLNYETFVGTVIVE